jgi:tRNA (mo5U34)-methyltransferase
MKHLIRLEELMPKEKAQTLETQIFDPRTPIEKEIAGLGPWFHNLHFEGGIQTAPHHPLGDFPKFKWEQISVFLPQDLSGWHVLDIGCNAGFYTFELARRGADVLGIDINEHYLKQAEWAAQKLNLKGKVRFRKHQVYDLAKMQTTFDLILFMGVFYHLRYPLLALDIIAQKFSQFLIFQTMTMPGDKIVKVPDNLEIDDRDRMLDEGFPKIAFIERALSGDITNWWAPNSSAVEAILRSSGLEIISKPAHEIYICRKDPKPFKMRVVAFELDAVTGIMTNNLPAEDDD